jgi:hypothetical protein
VNAVSPGSIMFPGGGWDTFGANIVVDGGQRYPSGRRFD